MLAALITMLLTPVLIVLLCATVIGIAAVPFVVAGLFCASLFGKAVILAWVGRRVIGKHHAGSLSHPAVAVLIGGLLVLVLYMIPVLGFLVYKALGVLGFGAVVYTLVLAARARQATKTEGRRATPGPSPFSPDTAPQTPGSSTQAPEATRQTANAAPQPMESAQPATASQPYDMARSGTSAPPNASAPQGTSAPPNESPSQGTSAPPNDSASRRPPPNAAVHATLPRAGFWRRMAALLVDVLLIGFLMTVLHHAFRLELVALATYGAVMWKLRGSTIGGIVFDLKVVRLDGREMDWATAIVRALACFLSLAVAGLGFFWIAFDAESQAWHDKIAGTVVVRVAKGAPLV